MKLLVFISAVVLFGVSCMTKHGVESSLDYAHGSPQKTVSTPLGYLWALSLGYKTNFEKITTCVQTDSKTYPAQNVLLETQLAYHYWISSAINLTDDVWKKFQFVASPKCLENEKKYNSIIVIPGKEEDLKLAKIGPNPVTFPKPILKCKKTITKNKTPRGTTTRTSSQCSSQITKGLASVASSSYRLFQDNGKWTEINNINASPVYGSPYVEWFPLVATKLENDPDGSKLTKIKTEYQKLLAQKSWSVKDLEQFNKLLFESVAISDTNDAIKPFIETFKKSDKTELEDVFRPSYAFYSTLLHEVGHQFGLDHAHDPPAGAITGESPFTKKIEDVYYTDIAAMAYGKSYYYLTADDRAGIRSVSKQTQKFLIEKKAKRRPRS